MQPVNNEVHTVPKHNTLQYYLTTLTVTTTASQVVNQIKFHIPVSEPKSINSLHDFETFSTNNFKDRL